MSLIQEALKRQQEDDRQKTVPAPDPIAVPAPDTPAPEKKTAQAKAPIRIAVPTPPPPPPADETVETPGTDSSSPATKRSSRTWLTLAGVIVLVLLFLGGAVWMLSFVFKHLKAKQSIESTVRATIAEVVPDASQPETSDAAPHQGATLPTASNAASADVVATPAMPGPGTPGRDAVAGSAATVSTSASPATPTAGNGESPATPAVQWPAVSLDGMVGKGGSGAAIVNKKILSVGESIEGVKLVSIENDGVYLEYSGDRRFLKVGNQLQ